MRTTIRCTVERIDLWTHLCLASLLLIVRVQASGTPAASRASLSSNRWQSRTTVNSTGFPPPDECLSSVKVALDGNSYDPRHRRRIQAISDSPDAFDVLRMELASLDDDTAIVSFPTANSSIFEVSMLAPENLVTYRLAELKVFIALSNGQTPIPTNMDEGFAVLLAVHHFNNMQDAGHPVLGDYISRYPELQSCNVKLTVELFDSQLSPTKTTQTFTSVWRRPVSIETPPTTAVVGSSRSSETSPLAIFTGVNSVPQVTATSTSTIFDDKDQFPLFGRTVTSTSGEAAAAVRYFASIGSTHVAILFVTDAYGSGLEEAFRDETIEFGIQTDSFAYDVSATDEDLSRMMTSLKQSQFRHVFAICFEEKLVPLLDAAVKAEAIGRDFLYIFPTIDPVGIKEFLRDSTASSKAMRGAGIIQMQGGVAIERFKLGEKPSSVYKEVPLTSFDRFRTAWRDAVNNETLVSYIRSKFPATVADMPSFDRNFVLNRDPNGFLNFNYDATVSLGLAMCRAGENKTFFTGEDIYAQFRQLDFEGASGRVKIIPETGTRDYATIAFTMWNIRTDANSTLEFVLSARFEENQWNEISGNAFEFADGTTAAPGSLPPVPSNLNYIGNSSRAVAYTFAGSVMLVALMSFAWTVIHINDHVVDTAQPIFLAMISIGAFTMTSSVFPLGFDETVVSYSGNLDTACMAVPWLYFVGASIALGALLAKTKAVNEAYVDPEILEIQVSSADVFMFTGALASLNGVTLFLWSVTTPLAWTREDLDATDIFNRPLESYATCRSDGSIGFAVALVAINFGFLSMGTFWAYRTRNIATEYNESRCIGLSIAAILQAWSMSIPVLIIVQDIPFASFLIKSGLIVLSAFILLSFVFLPKVIAARSEFLQAQRPPRRVKEFARNPNLLQNSGNDDNSDEEKTRPSSTEERPSATLGHSLVSSSRRRSMKIIHNPRSSINLVLSCGIELSRRQLQVFIDVDDEGPGSNHDENFDESDSNDTPSCAGNRRISELGNRRMSESGVINLSLVDEQDDDRSLVFEAANETLPSIQET